MDKDVFMVKQAVTQASSASIGTGPPSRGRRRSPGGGLRRLSLVGAIATAVVVGAACNGGGEARPDQSSTSATQANATTSPTSANPSTTTSSSPDEAAAATAWRTLWNAATRQPGTEEAARKAADTAVVDRLLALTREPRAVTSSPTPTTQTDGRIAITDCTFVAPTLSASATIGFVGAVARDPGGTWRVTEFAPRNAQLQPCAPEEMVEDSIDGYRSYWDKRPLYWDPADPTSPLIDETAVDKRLASIREQLSADKAANRAFRGRPTLHPEVIEVHSSTELVILDCQLQDPGWGVYDRSTGELTGESTPVAPGRRDLRSTVMRVSNGRWKVADIQGREGATCDFAPTTQALPVL
jgi:hypothetical protein